MPAHPLATPLLRRHRRVTRAVRRHRRPLGALLAVAAVLAGVQAAATPPTPTVDVLVAAADLPPGTVLTSRHLAHAAFLPAAVPAGTLVPGRALGRRTLGPVRAGEPLTDARVLDAGLLMRYPGTAAVPVRLGDAGAARLLRVGQLVTVLAADPQTGGPAVTVAERVPVLALPRGDTEVVGSGAGALVVLALDPVTARDVAGAATGSYLTAMAVR